MGRVVYALLGAAVRLAARAGFPLARVRELLDMAYFQEHRRRGRSLAQVSEALGVSERKGAQLSSLMKKNFMPADAEVGLARKIEFMIWAEPLGRARIIQLLRRHEEADIDAAIETLLKEKRVQWVKRGRVDALARTRQNSRLVGQDLERNLDGLQNLCHNLANAAYAGFFRDEPKASIRTIGFYMRAEDAAELKELYSHVWETAVRLEERAKDDPNAMPVDMSVLYAPTNYFHRDGDQHE